MKWWTKIMLGVAVAVAMGYLLMSIFYLGERQDAPKCSRLLVEVSDYNKRQYIDTTGLYQHVMNVGLNPKGLAATSKRCQEIEDSALHHPMVRTAKCYSTTDGDVVLSVTQRRPVMRVQSDGEEGYYLDTDTNKMVITSQTAADVPVVTGRVGLRMAKKDLYSFVMWLEDDDFWSAQVAQINVVSPSYIELVPRIGSGTIILGSLENYKQKLKKLKTLYQDGFSKFGWKDYREIDLRYKGQIVCR